METSFLFVGLFDFNLPLVNPGSKQEIFIDHSPDHYSHNHDDPDQLCARFSLYVFNGIVGSIFPRSAFPAELSRSGCSKNQDAPQQKSPSMNTTQIVGIVLIKNEDVHIEQAVRNIVQFCDSIIITDHQSQDRTYEILERLAKEYPSIVLKRIEHPRESHKVIE